MRVQVDPTKCEGHGICHDKCPSAFAIDEWGYAYTFTPDGTVAPGDEQAAADAAGSCPEGAIAVTSAHPSTTKD